MGEGPARISTGSRTEPASTRARGRRPSLVRRSRERSAIRWLRRDGGVEELSYRALQERPNRFANVLTELGIERGERLFCFTGRIPGLYAVALGTLKRGCVFSPLFSAFGPEPARQRLELGDARVPVTTASL